jgi:hypothetical protein
MANVRLTQHGHECRVAIKHICTCAAHAVRLITLTQFDWCASNTNCPTIPIIEDGAVRQSTIQAYVVSRMLLPYERRWEAAGWLCFLVATFWTLSFFTYRFFNHQKR